MIYYTFLNNIFLHYLQLAFFIVSCFYTFQLNTPLSRFKTNIYIIEIICNICISGQCSLTNYITFFFSLEKGILLVCCICIFLTKLEVRIFQISSCLCLLGAGARYLHHMYGFLHECKKLENSFLRKNLLTDQKMCELHSVKLCRNLKVKLMQVFKIFKNYLLLKMFHDPIFPVLGFDFFEKGFLCVPLKFSL